MLHKVVRNRIYEAVSNFARPFQLGGFKGMSPVFGSLGLRLFQRIAVARRRSFCVLFVDVKGAYYAAYRQLLVSALPRSGTLLALIDQLPASDLVKLRLRQRLDEANLLQKLPLSPAWRAFCEETLQDTWFSTEGAPNLTLTQRGSRPGDPLADLLFAVLLSDLDQELHCSLQAAGFIDAQPRLDFQTSSLDGQEPLPSIIWADDMAIPQSFCSPSELYFRLPDLCRIVSKFLLRTACSFLPDLGRRKSFCGLWDRMLQPGLIAF